MVVTGMKLYLGHFRDVMARMLLALVFCLSLWFCPTSVQGQDVAVTLEKDQVFVGESFGMRIKVTGDDSPSEPVLSESQDFSVEFDGGSRDSRSSVVIINGRMVKNEESGYVFSYRLIAKRAGKLLIPTASVRTSGGVLYTKMHFITAVKPGESQDFKLRMEFSSAEAYVGQPLTLTITWYLAKDVQGFQFHLPFLNDERFRVVDFEERINPAHREEYLQIDVGGGDTVARKMRLEYKGREFTALRFRKVLIPKEAGTLRLGQSTVAFNALAGYRRGGLGGGLFDSFDDFFQGNMPFGMGRQAIYKKMVAPSNEPVVTVKELPSEGRPANFSGLVGEYRVAAEALPTEARVGDPITLTVQVAGPDYLEQVELPNLAEDKNLTRDFKVPAEIAPGKVNGAVKTFTQTIRAKRADVKEVPAIELPYFDVRSGRYKTARTQPIPLKIQATRVVTALDAEGREVQDISGSEIETWTQGIAHNYEDESVLKKEDLPPLIGFWPTLLLIPPGAYILLLVGTALVRRRLADPAALKFRAALREFNAAVSEIKSARPGSADYYAALLRALREYLAAKLRKAPAGLALNEVLADLQQHLVPVELRDRLQRLYELCEAGSYGGSELQSAQTPQDLVSEALILVKQIERGFR
ncbi:MAG: protein BatD [Deltaproteobacteria bacterium]|nr:protein BatD [Deltaproteobacteria bacterium]